MKPRQEFYSSRANNKGISLPIALILLIAGALIAAASAQSSSWNTRANNGWSDRQRALFQAESIIKVAEDRIETLMTDAGDDIPTAVRGAGAGFLVRGDSGVPASWKNWPSNAAIVGSTTGTDASEFFVIYEGAVLYDAETGLSGASGSSDLDSAVLHRYSIVVKAGGRQEGTSVVLQVVRQY
jgi:type IV pilus assembly protein PilX